MSENVFFEHYTQAENLAENDFHLIPLTQQDQNLFRNGYLAAAMMNFPVLAAALKENVCPNQENILPKLETPIDNIESCNELVKGDYFQAEQNNSGNCNERVKNEYFEYDLFAEVMSNGPIPSDEQLQNCVASMKRRRDSDSLAHPSYLKRALIAEDPVSSHIADFSKEHLQEILKIFSSCQPNLECAAVEIEDNLPQEFVLRNSTLKIRRDAYFRIFHSHPNMVRRFETCGPARSSQSIRSGQASRRKKNIVVGIAEAVGPILEELHEKLMEESFMNRSYLRSLLYVLFMQNEEQNNNMFFSFND